MKYLKLQYGNGTQIARVEGETAKRFTIRRFSDGEWNAKTSAISKADVRIHDDVTQADIVADLAGRIGAASSLWSRRLEQRSNNAHDVAYATRRLAKLEADLAELRGEGAELVGRAKPAAATAPVAAAPGSWISQES